MRRLWAVLRIAERVRGGPSPNASGLAGVRTHGQVGPRLRGYAEPRSSTSASCSAFSDASAAAFASSSQACVLDSCPGPLTLNLAAPDSGRYGVPTTIARSALPFRSSSTHRRDESQRQPTAEASQSDRRPPRPAPVQLMNAERRAKSLGRCGRRGQVLARPRRAVAATVGRPSRSHDRWCGVATRFRSS